jgi:hypothetical protein
VSFWIKKDATPARTALGKFQKENKIFYHVM